VLLAFAFLAACGGGGGGGNRNRAPLASGATLAVNEDQGGTVSPPVSDPDNDALTPSIVAAPTKGTASVTTNQPLVITYVPNANANGVDGFDYRVSDGRGGTATAHVAVTVAPVADAPAIVAQSFSASEDVQLDATIVANDPDVEALTFTVTTPPVHGKLQLTNSAAGTFSYVPAAEFSGADSFAVSVSDAGGLTTAAQMSLTVQAVNDAPVAVDDTFVAAANGTTTFDVLANDTDVDDAQLTVEVQDAFGVTAAVVGNKIQVTPAAGALGPSSVVYRARDAAGALAKGIAQFVIGAAVPVFYRSDESSPGDSRIFRYDMLKRVEIDTPVGANERLEKFVTSADGSALVYVTRVTGSQPARHRLRFKDLTDDTAPVQEIPTATNFFASWLAISPDGQHIVFNQNYVSRASIAQPTSYGSDIAWPRFTEHSDFLYYVEFLAGGGRVIKRVPLNPGGGIGSSEQMSASPPVAEGRGLTLGLSPDETLIASTGLIVTQFGPKSYAYVTPADGSQNDILLHPIAITAVDGAQQPTVTADNAYAYYTGTMNNVTGLYATDLQSPGTAVRVDNAPVGFFINSPVVLPDARTLFYNVTSLGSPSSWRKGRIDQPGVAEIYSPEGVSGLRHLVVAPDGSALVLTTDGGTIYVAGESGFAVATQLLALPGTTIVESPAYASDGTSAAIHVADGIQPGRLYLVNPKIPGWSQDLSPVTGKFGVDCVAYAGSGC
jgi:hypothetical protein